jgi:hypothetical protein
VERLRADAAGKYAAKESGKRFQKVAPERWQGVAWWRQSRNVKCVPVAIMTVDDRRLTKAKCTVNGETRYVPYRVQNGMGSTHPLVRREKERQ